MIPVYLKIQGVYSYEKAVEIDFSRLLESQLFGIFGAVGSGKSTILEAMTFALYGRTERLGRGNQYNLMNLRSDSLEIDFQFRAGPLQDLYRFEAYARRNSKNFENISRQSRNGYIWKEGEWQPLPSNDAGEVLDLSYENFTKTIILPQGKFQEFLHLSAADRTNMLMELFDLQRYELSEPTKRLRNRVLSELDQLRGKLEGLPEVDAEALEAGQTALKQMVAEAEGQGKELDARRKAVAQMEQQVNLQQQVRESEAEQQRLAERETEMTLLEKRLNRYVRTRQLFADKIALQLSIREQLAGTREKLAQLNSGLEAKNRAFGEAEGQFEQAQKAYEAREEFRSKADELRHALKVQELDQQMWSLGNRIVKGQELVEQKGQEKARVAEELESLNKAYQLQREQVKAWPDLADLQAWYARKDQVRQAAEAAAQSRQRESEAVDTANAALQEALSSGQDKLPDAAAVRTALLAAEKQETALQQQLAELRLQRKLEEFAEGLRPGEPCPLCGATDHPAPYDAHSADADVQRLEGEQQALASRLDALQRLDSRLPLLQQSLDEAQARLRTATETEQQAQAELAAHLAAFRWEGHSPEDAATVQQELDRRKAVTAELDALESRREAGRMALEKVQAELLRFEQAITGLNQELVGIRTERKTLASMVQHYELDKITKVPKEELEAKRDFQLAQYTEVGEAYRKADASRKALREQVQSLREQQAGEQRQLEELTGRGTELEQELSRLLEEEGYEQMEQVHRILGEELDAEQLQKQLGTYRDAVRDVATRLEMLRSQLAGTVVDPVELEQAREALRQAEEAYVALQNQIGERRKELERMQEDLEKRGQLGLQLEQLELRKSNLDTLASLFKGKGFVKYVSSVYLQELCQRANERFQQLTRNQLMLEIDAENNFLIRDMLNGGQTRSVKTLSGGQTFQASLSLALALADNIYARQQSEQNFFFLDEGFGTLDREALHIVFDTLKALRRENRVVGVISHVEEMQQEIDACLLVSQDEDGISSVRGSWES